MTASAASRLRGVPLLAGLSDHHIERLAARVTQRRLEAGEWLFHAGEPGDSLFVITAGSLDVIDELPTPTLIRTMRRGESVGELAILTDTPRSVAIRAHRDTELLRLERVDVEALLLDQPTVAASLIASLATRLHANRTPPTQRQSPPATIALVPLHPGAPLEEIAGALTAALERLGTVARLDGDEPVPLEMLDRIEQGHDRILLVAVDPSPANPWTAYCLRQADRVVGLAGRPAAGGGPTQHARLRGCDVALLTAPGVEPDLTGWMKVLSPRTTHILRTGSPDGVERMARRLAGRSLGVVLSGGGARGFAHVGVLEELHNAGYVVDRIGGVSMGAMVGSLFAEERSADEVAAVLRDEYIRTTPLAGWTIPLVALSRGERGFAAQHLLHAGRRIEGLDVNFFCVSADLAGQQQVVHREGLVAIAVSASQALPAFVPPVQDGDRMMVDGAILNNLPVDPMLAMGEGPVVAVDVGGRLPPPRPPRSKIPMRLRRWIIGPSVDWAPLITETLLRSILLGNVATDAAARARAALVITPELKGVSTMKFNDIDGPRASGRAATRAAIAAGQLDALGVHRRR